MIHLQSLASQRLTYTVVEIINVTLHNVLAPNSFFLSCFMWKEALQFESSAATQQPVTPTEVNGTSLVVLTGAHWTFSKSIDLPSQLVTVKQFLNALNTTS